MDAHRRCDCATARCAARASDGDRGVPGHPVRHRRALRAARAGGAVDGRARCDRVRADRPPGRRAPSSSGPTSSRTSSACRSTCGRRPPTTRAGPSWCGSTAAPSAPARRQPALRGHDAGGPAATWWSSPINYRLGAARVPRPPRPRPPTTASRAANWGLLDCIEALRWVQAQRRGVRRRPGRRHDLRRVGRRGGRVAPVRHAGGTRACSTRRWCRAVRR